MKCPQCQSSEFQSLVGFKINWNSFSARLIPAGLAVSIPSRV
ncbi:hypothetical protein BFG60_3054 [Microcystis aeruginosa NIES-98]|nr:hypothetical protein BFG60_3054 [Microcystis aeruginosa NIES-98]